MAGMWDYLFNAPGSAGGGLLPTAPRGWQLMPQAAPAGGMLPPPSAAPVVPAGAPATVTPRGQPTWLAGISDFLKNNPTLISNIAANVGGTPNFRTGLAKAAAGIPQAQASDLAWSDQLKTRSAINAFLSDPATIKAYGPQTIAILKSDPEIAKQLLLTQLVPRPAVAVAPGGELRDPITGAVRGPSSNPFASATDQSQDDGSLGPSASAPTVSAPAPIAVADASPTVGEGAAGASPPSASPAAPASLSAKATRNEAFLKTLAPDQQQLVKDFADYKTNPADIYSTRQYVIPQAIAAAQKYDPSYDPSKFPIIQKVKTDFTSGSNAVSVQAANTLTGHLFLLKQFADALQNGNFPDANAANNWLKEHAGDPSISNFNTLVNGIQAEAAKVYSGAGMTESDRQAWAKVLNPNMSPDQINGAIDTAVHMMSSRLGSMAFQYQSVTGQQPNILSPQSRAIMAQLGIDPDAVLSGTLPEMKKAVPNPSAGAGGGGGAPVRITGDADYAKLRSGTHYVGPDGLERVKP